MYFYLPLYILLMNKFDNHISTVSTERIKGVHAATWINNVFGWYLYWFPQLSAAPSSLTCQARISSCIHKPTCEENHTHNLTLFSPYFLASEMCQLNDQKYEVIYYNSAININYWILPRVERKLQNRIRNEWLFIVFGDSSKIIYRCARGFPFSTLEDSSECRSFLRRAFAQDAHTCCMLFDIFPIPVCACIVHASFISSIRFLASLHALQDPHNIS